MRMTNSSQEEVTTLQRSGEVAKPAMMAMQMHGFIPITEEEAGEEEDVVYNNDDQNHDADEELVLLAAAKAVKRVRFRGAAGSGASANVKLNEDDYSIGSSGATTTTITIAAAAPTIDKEDYVGNVWEEEEDGTYKTTSVLATLPQSEHDIIHEQQQQQQDDQRSALISTISLFLVEAWNWLHYFLVSIILLNLVHFADRRSSQSGDSVVGEEEILASEVDGLQDQEEEDIEPDKKNQEVIVGNKLDSSGGSEEFSGNGNKMSPNTLSMQNQQAEAVEKAQEAFAAVVSANEKGTMTVDIATCTAEAEVDNIIIATPMKKDATVQQPEITVVLAGDAEEDSDENDSDDTTRRDSVDSCTSSEGNFGDTEEAPESKSSDEKSNSGNENEEDHVAPKSAPVVDNKETAQRIISQVETMFSDEHLAKDGFLLKHVRRRSDGFVSLKLVAGLRKVKQITREFPVVLNALKDSPKLEINAEGTKVRRVEPLTPFLKTVPIKSKEKDGKQTKEKDNGSSNDENSQPQNVIENVSGNNNNKSASKTGNKENDTGKRGQNRRNSNQMQNGSGSRRNSNANSNHGHHQDNHSRKNSNASTTSSNGSRNNSFSKPAAPPLMSAHPYPQHPADLLRNVYTMSTYSSSGEECQSPQAGRRRGGSLPIAALKRHSAGAYLSPNSSPPRNGQSSAGGPFFTIGPNGGARPKSNSYCEGAGPSTMSPWLQRRKASASSRLSQGDLIITEVIRQPKGPDGTKGFQPGYRAMMMKERLQQRNSEVSA